MKKERALYMHTSDGTIRVVVSMPNGQDNVILEGDEAMDWVERRTAMLLSAERPAPVEMTMAEYDSFVENCWFSGDMPLQNEITISALGLAGESGEVMEKILCAASQCVAASKQAEREKKIVRGDEPKPDNRAGVIGELGDVLFYVVNQARLHGYTLSDVVASNVSKLTSRNARGTKRGDGDAR